MRRNSTMGFLLLCLPLAAQAQQPINRCLGADGNLVFTDRPCGALQSVPLAPVKPASPKSGPSELSEPPGAPANRSAHTCASSVAELKQSVLEAFASRNANRLSGLMLWRGYRHSAVVADIRALQSLLRQPLLGIQVADSADALTVSTPAPYADGQPTRTRFAIERRSGCLWLRADE
jgi:hypothetical protein